MIKRTIELKEDEYELLAKLLNHANYAATTIEEFNTLKYIKKHLGCYSERRKTYEELNNFTKQIFLGNGSSSIVQVNRLHQRLDYAIMLLGGIQQSRSASEEDQNKKAKEDIRQVIFDICRALDEKEIENAATMQEVMK